MKITSIELLNWRAYDKAIFSFDVSDAEKNCVLIGAPNGFGKTSLFEAITLCVYGQKGLPVLARASDTRGKTIYNDFLQNVIHKSALKSHTRCLSVKISFKDSDGEKVRVERQWYFSSSGMHKPEGEQFVIWVNDQVQTLEPGQDPTDWEAELINKYFVPHSLAQFFLFDGEMVRDLAKMDQAKQVREGIEGLMGVPILTNLIGSLETYARTERSKIPKTEKGLDPAMLAKEIEVHENKVSELEKEVASLETEITDFEEEQRRLFEETMSFGNDGSAKKGELHQELKDTEIQRNNIDIKLQKQLVFDFSIGLAGYDLLQSAMKMLDADQILADWESSKNQGEKGYDNFITTIESKLTEEKALIPVKYHSEIVKLIKSNWDSIWHPKPEDCPNEYFFPEAYGSMRGDIAKNFGRLLNEAGSGLQNSFNEIAELDNVIAGFKSKIKTLEAETSDPIRKGKVNRLTEIQKSLNSCHRKKVAKESERAVEKKDKNDKNATLQHINSLHNNAKPHQDAAKKADHIKKVVQEIIKEIIPLQSNELAEKMSLIYRELSNKSVVKKVEIDDEFNVKLIGENEQNIRETKMSAGEEQIFSQTLISSVVQVSNFDFPMIVDTPLARLDDAHRTSILKHFKNSKRQVIFLSTDTEIIGKYFDLLKNNISDTFKLSNKTSENVGYTSVERGYF